MNRMSKDLPITERDPMNNWTMALDAHEVRFLLLDRHSDSELLELFRSQSDWSVEAEDKETVLFARADIA